MAEERRWDRASKVLTIGAVSNFESSDVALEKLVELKELEFGDVFTDRNTELDTDERSSLSITFYHEDVFNQLFIGINDDNELFLSLTLSDSYVSEYSSILTQILEIVSTTTIRVIQLEDELDVDFSDLELPIRDDQTVDVTGIRCLVNEIDYIIQENRDRETVELLARNTEEIELNDVSDVKSITEEIESIDMYVAEELR